MTTLSSATRRDLTNASAVTQKFGTADVWQLSNGRYSVAVGPDGSGYAEFLGQAITRPSCCPFRQRRGFYFYLRDVQSGDFWSTTFQPTLIGPHVAATSATASRIELAHGVSDILVTTSIEIPAEYDGELRTCHLANVGSTSRRIELTSYAELVLGDATADANHTAFSKLFIETGYCAERSMLWGRRRPRSAEQKCIMAAQICLGESEGNWDPSSEFETDRARFLGRGRGLTTPRVMVGREPLSGTVGSVLDPVLSLRRFVEIGPGDTAEITWAFVAAEDETSLFRHVDRLRSSWTSNTAHGAANRPYVPVGNASPRATGAMTTVITPAAARDGQTNLATAGVEDSQRHGQRKIATRAKRRTASPQTTSLASVDQLQFFNGIGGFSANGAEYVIRLGPDEHGDLVLPPMPWANVIANPQIGFVVSETGASCTWVGNSRENRVTPWSNDPISDPHAEAFYVRDEDLQCYWSPLPGPAPHTADYEVRHGLGYTRFRHESEELLQDVTQFVPCDDPLKISCLEFTNFSKQPRNLSLFAYHRWDLESGTDPSNQAIEVCVDRSTGSILARNRCRQDYANGIAFSSFSTAAQGARIDYCLDAARFFGPGGSSGAPATVCYQTVLPEPEGESQEPCAVTQLRVHLAPGENFQCVCLLGEASSAEAADELIRRYQSFANCRHALEQVRRFWTDLPRAVQITTPCKALDLMVNNWLPYQTLSGRLWGRTSLYQSGGAFGFRDQLQDASAFTFHQPDLMRQQILLHAAHQFVEGDVMHWWHPPASRGLRTRFSDDLLWLPLIAAEYVQTTGDTALWDEQVRFLEAQPLEESESEVYLEPVDSETSGSLFEHCCRAIDRSLSLGAHGLPLIGCGDWNDGMNRIGIAGRGESVWLGFFLYTILQKIIPVCQQRGELLRARRYQQHGERLYQALNDSGWDGEWYRRAFFDDGTPLGSKQNGECRIDALVQAWSILAGVAPADRADLAVQAVEDQLVCEEGGLIRLLAPPLDKTAHDPGYIKGYLPGIRENGGQYTHGVLWFIRALTDLGKGTRAAELLEMLCPVNHARTASELAIYQVEPYVVAADVYCVTPHVGRGGWTWYTGSAGWMFRVAVESILGLGMEDGNTLVLKPCISRDWPSCQLRYRLPTGEQTDRPTTYEITIANPQGRESGVSVALVDGEEIPVENGAARIPIQRDGAQHDVRLLL